MALTHIQCADWRYRRDETKHLVTLPDCLECAATRANKCQFTYEMLSSMFAQQQDREDRISTTTLTAKCLRSEFLKRALPHSEKPEKMWASFRGTMFHGQLENHAHIDSVEEARFHVDLPGLGHLSGSPDLLDVSKGILYDYKFTKEVPRFDYPWDDHKMQMQVNRWLVDHADYVEYRDKRHKPDRFRPVEWQALVVVYMDDKGPKPITITQSVQVPKKGGDGTKAARMPYIMPDDEVEAWIRQRYAEVKSVFENLEAPPIPDNFVGWDHPLCGFCPLKKECINLELNPEFEVTYEIRRNVA